MNQKTTPTAEASAIDVNPHSDLPATPDISIEIPEPVATDKPLPFGVYSGRPSKISEVSKTSEV